LNAKFDELETNRKIKNIRDLYRGISDFKKGYQHISNMVKDENNGLFTDSHNILARWRKHFSQLFVVHGVSNVRQTEIHTAETLVPEPSATEVEMTILNQKIHKSTVIDQNPTELITTGCRTICSEIHKHLNSIWNM
jgi:hypothetical protein